MKSPSTSDGKRSIAWVRSATHDLESLAAQSSAIREYAREHDMMLVDEINMSDRAAFDSGVERLIERKDRVNDYDVLLVASWDRLSRGGPLAAENLILKFQKAGIAVVIADAPNGLNFKDIAVQKENFARSVSFGFSAPARGSLFIKWRVDGDFRPPLGIDRLYVDRDNLHQHIIRVQPDGSQIQLDPETKLPVKFFPRGSGYPNMSTKMWAGLAPMPLGDQPSSAF